MLLRIFPPFPKPLRSNTPPRVSRCNPGVLWIRHVMAVEVNCK